MRKSEERFRLFMDHSPAVAWMKDEERHYIYMSESYLKQLGVRLEDRLGKTDFEVYPCAIAEELRKNDQAALAFGPSHRSDRGSPVGPHGEPRIWLAYKFPFQDASGQVFVGGIGIDITEQKKSEETLHDLTGRLISAQEEERARIAGNCMTTSANAWHCLESNSDSYGRNCHKMRAEDRRCVQKMLKETKELSTDLHTLSHELHSSKLEYVGLGPALAGLCKEFGLKYEIEVRFAEIGKSLQRPEGCGLMPISSRRRKPLLMSLNTVAPIVRRLNSPSNGNGCHSSHLRFGQRL